MSPQVLVVAVCAYLCSPRGTPPNRARFLRSGRPSITPPRSSRPATRRDVKKFVVMFVSTSYIAADPDPFLTSCLPGRCATSSLLSCVLLLSPENLETAIMSEKIHR